MCDINLVKIALVLRLVQRSKAPLAVCCYLQYVATYTLVYNQNIVDSHLTHTPEMDNTDTLLGPECHLYRLT